MQPKYVTFRRDLIRYALENGYIGAEGVRHIADKYEYSDEHIRRTIRILISEGLIQKKFIVTEAGKAYLGEDQ